jgi:hypothetical protein
MYKPLIAVVAATTLLLVGGASTASAFQIPSAQYTGTHSAGGAVSFRVSHDGNAIREFRIENYQTEFCDVEFVQHLGSAPIVNNAFSFASVAEEFSYSGTFPGVQLAQGTFTDDECATGPLTWSASTTASPAGSAVCIAAQGPATEAEAAYAAAQAKVAQANAKLKRNVKQVNNAKRAVKRAVKKKAKPRVKRKAQNRLRAAIKQRTRTNGELRRAKAANTQAAAAMAQAQAAKTAVCGPGV